MARKKITSEQITAAEAQLQTMQRQVDYDTKDYTVELLLSKFERGDFFIPDYQLSLIHILLEASRMDLVRRCSYLNLLCYDILAEHTYRGLWRV